MKRNLFLIAAFLFSGLASCKCRKGGNQNSARVVSLQKKEEKKTIRGLKEVEKIYLEKRFKVSKREAVIRGQTFVMGIQHPENEREKMSSPAHKVTLNYIFSIWKTEVTQREFERVMNYNPSYFKDCGPNCPVENVTWHEAAYFANQLSIQMGLNPCFSCLGRGKTVVCRVFPQFQGQGYLNCNGFRLPTEAEWEFAARAGSKREDLLIYELPEKSRLRAGSDQKNRLISEVDLISWHADNSEVSYSNADNCYGSKNRDKKKCGTHPVGRKLPNRWGIYDMLGNVSEWVFDRYGPYLPGIIVNPVGPDAGRRVFRGCSWFHRPSECFIQARYYAAAAFRSNGLGFRIARTLLFYSKVFR